MNQKVLLITENKAYLEYLETILSRNNFDTASSRSCIGALRQLKTEAADIIVLDEEIAGPDAWESCLQLREKCHAPILMTGRSCSDLTVIKAITHGADFYMEIPFNEKEFIARINALLRRLQLTRENGNSEYSFKKRAPFRDMRVQNEPG
ncbi:MAG: response regulator [Dehalococcoidia bacterium]|nr:response regulator [Dehalococcoidia bacterium]